MGSLPEGKTLDRINVNGNYEPGNCRWATRKEQARNTRVSKFVNYEGKRMTQAEFAEVIRHNQSTVSYRVRAGWTSEQIANTPAHKWNRIASKLGSEAEVPESLIES